MFVTGPNLVLCLFDPPSLVPKYYSPLIGTPILPIKREIELTSSQFLWSESNQQRKTTSLPNRRREILAPKFSRENRWDSAGFHSVITRALLFSSNTPHSELSLFSFLPFSYNNQGGGKGSVFTSLRETFLSNCAIVVKFQVRNLFLFSQFLLSILWQREGNKRSHFVTRCAGTTSWKQKTIFFWCAASQKASGRDCYNKLIFLGHPVPMVPMLPLETMVHLVLPIWLLVQKCPNENSQKKQHCLYGCWY